MGVFIALSRGAGEPLPGLLPILLHIPAQEIQLAQGILGKGISLFGGSGQVLVLNANNKLVQYVLEHTDGENTPKICEQLYDLAQLSHGSLTPERMTKFIARSNEIMGMMLN